MPLELATSVERLRTIECPTEFGPVTVSYRIDAYTTSLEMQTRALITTGQVALAITQMLSTMLAAWDITKNGVPVPPLAEALVDLPLSLIAEIMAGIGNDVAERAARRTTTS